MENTNNFYSLQSSFPYLLSNGSEAEGDKQKKTV